MTGKSPVHLVIDSQGAAASPAVAPGEVVLSFQPWLDITGRDFGYGFEDDEGYHLYVHGLGSFHFTRNAGVVRAVPAPEVTQDTLRDTFRRHILPRVLQWHGWEVIHASGLVVAGAGIALCGDSEAGKSTLAYAWRRRGGDIYADDAVFLRVEASSVSLQPLPFRIRLRPPSSSYFGAGVPDLNKPGENGCSAATPCGIALRAIYLLQRRREGGEGECTLQPVAPADAFAALLQQSFCLTAQDRARNCRMVQNYMSLADAVPTFSLSYPTGLEHVDRILDRLQEHAAALVKTSASTARARAERT
jgi:hypothetical protein